MAQKIFIPKLGMTMEEATIIEWVAKEGEKVEEGQVVLILDTEKVAHEIEASFPGFLVVMGEVGQTYPCGTVIGMLAETKEEYEAIREKDLNVGEIKKSHERTPVATKTDVTGPSEMITEGEKRIFISPLARKIAHIEKVDITKIIGTGPNGRIKKRDIEKAISQGHAGSEVIASTELSTVPKAGRNMYDGKRVKESIPLKGMRKAIAEHTHYSLSVSAQVTVMTEMDMTQLIRLRDEFIEKADKIGERISYTDLFIFAATKALKASPMMNASLIDNEIKIWEEINIGFAMSLDLGDNQSGLVVPVIKNVERMGLAEICQSRKALVGKARDGKLSRDDTNGGTFSITNTSMFTPGWHVQTPIINQPQSAILGTSATVDRPVVLDGQIVIRPIMPISLTFDHRVLDGSQPGIFIATFKEMLEEPVSMLL